VTDQSKYEQIVTLLSGKGAHKCLVLNHTKSAFQILKEEGKQLVADLNESLEGHEEVKVAFRDLGDYQFRLLVDEDVLIFNLHEEVFDIEKSHPLWKSSYLKDNRLNAFCGMITIFNFLTTSIESNRPDDIGNQIGRVFINLDNHFFVEGKKEVGYLYSNFSDQLFNTSHMRELLLSTVLHCLGSDLTAPPFETFGVLNVAQINEINRTLGARSYKPLGFTFKNEDDIAK
jgi:hypothetical protein